MWHITGRWTGVDLMARPIFRTLRLIQMLPFYRNLTLNVNIGKVLNKFKCKLINPHNLEKERTKCNWKNVLNTMYLKITLI